MIKGRVSKRNAGSASAFLIIMGLLSYCCVYASDFERLDSEGLQGRKLLSVGSDETDGQVAWVGKDGGIFRKDFSKNAPWQKIVLEDVAEVRVNRIEFSPYVSFGYAATSKGVYEIDPVSLVTRKIYSSNQDVENECLSVAVDANQNIYVATKAGLFAKSGKGNRWTKSVTVLGDKAISSVYAAGMTIYAAASEGLYQSMDRGKTWKKVFSLNEGREETVEEEEDVGEDDTLDRIHAVIGEKGAPSIIYLATSMGGFKSQDNGETWEPLPLTGLDSKDILDLIFSITPRKLYAVTKNGVFCSDAD